MVSLSFLAAVLTAQFICVLSRNDSDLSSNCTKTEKSLHEFEDEFLLGGKFTFAQNKGQIVLVTNVATF